MATKRLHHDGERWVREKRPIFSVGGLIGIVALLTLLVGIALPGLLRARIASNETSAIGTLRTLSTSQSAFQSAAIVDQDGDGTGEFGWLQELSGTTGYRDAAGGIVATPTSPAFITSVLGATAHQNGGVAQKSGYSFLVYLPTGSGPALAEAAGPPTFPDANRRAHGAGCKRARSSWCRCSTTANRQEVAFATYAFPTSFGVTGRRAFVVSQQGEVFATANEQEYRGPSKEAGKIPAAGAAYVASSTEDPANLEGQFVPGTPATDGHLWLPAGN